MRWGVVAVDGMATQGAAQRPTVLRLHKYNVNHSTQGEDVTRNVKCIDDSDKLLVVGIVDNRNGEAQTMQR